MTRYIGNELDIFSSAVQWKKYLSQKISPVIGTNVLEVGAGIGTNTLALCSVLSSTQHRQWLCVEPDTDLLNELIRRVKEKAEFSSIEIECRRGTLDNICVGERFDTILYIDVLEHIKDDELELLQATKFLSEGGKLIVVAPAHQWLYSPFDNAVGHFRRYNKETLTAITPYGLKLKQLYYLDLAGVAASAGNMLLLRKRLPTVGQIKFWNSCLIPISAKMDQLIGYKAGKTIVGVWEKHK